MIGLAALAAVSTMLAKPTLAVQFPKPGYVSIRLNGADVFEGKLTGIGSAKASDVTHVQILEDPATPMFLGYPHGPKTSDWAPRDRTKFKLVVTFDKAAGIEGDFTTDAESFACSEDPNAPISTSFGGATSGLDAGVYDRTGDWLATADSASTKISHLKGGFHLSASGPVTLTVKADYYRNHLGYFLWDKTRRMWDKPVAGWCSWAAYGQDVTERDVAKAAEFFGKNLREYGYDVIQIDDGYQRVLQITDNHQPITEPFSNYWTTPNSKFPAGMKKMAEVIADQKMIPGIWVGLYLPLGLKHSEAYVMGPDGKPLQGPWVGYSMDPGNLAAVTEAYTDTLKTFRAQGWRYFKIDTLRHVLYDSYRRVPEFWDARGTDSSAAFRHLFLQVREAVGKDDYLLACWGALPELAGLPDGCRIGEDVGPAFASMRKAAKYIAQFNYANDVIWRNDPDYMCLRVPVQQCQTWATMNSLAGGQVMVSDPIEAYDPARVDILRRVGPPVISRPGNALPMKPDPEWITFNGSQAGETWTVASRMAWKPLPAADVSLASLGLDPAANYLAYDFWAGKFLGVVHGSLNFHELGEGACQVVSFRPMTGAPQVLGDDRHISQGAQELEVGKFDGHTLSGRFLRTSDKAWTLHLFVPEGWSPADSKLNADRTVDVTIPAGVGWTNWAVQFTRSPG